MTKILTIDNCYECPHWQPVYRELKNYCVYKSIGKKTIIMGKITAIPEWCPLPDKGVKAGEE